MLLLLLLLHMVCRLSSGSIRQCGQSAPALLSTRKSPPKLRRVPLLSTTTTRSSQLSPEHHL